MKQFRQGDVLIIEREASPKFPMRMRRGTVVAHGEATGHSHRFNDESAVALYDLPDGDIWAEVSATTSLIHEEHEAIVLEAGKYLIRRQREYVPGSSSMPFGLGGTGYRLVVD